MAGLTPGKHACPKCGAMPLILNASGGVGCSSVAICSCCGTSFADLERMCSSLDIRVSPRDERHYRKIYDLSTLDRDWVTLSIDSAIKIPLIMVHADGSSHQWTIGHAHVESFLRQGYVDIRRLCPFRHRRCIGDRCSLSVLRNNTRDCALVWAVVGK